MWQGEESVLLSCHISVSDLRDSMVVWRREELKDPVVNYHTPTGDELTNQNQRYKNRTSMNKDAPLHL